MKLSILPTTLGWSEEEEEEQRKVPRQSFDFRGNIFNFHSPHSSQATRWDGFHPTNIKYTVCAGNKYSQHPTALSCIESLTPGMPNPYSAEIRFIRLALWMSSLHRLAVQQACKLGWKVIKMLSGFFLWRKEKTKKEKKRCRRIFCFPQEKLTPPLKSRGHRHPVCPEVNILPQCWNKFKHESIFITYTRDETAQSCSWRTQTRTRAAFPLTIYKLKLRTYICLIEAQQFKKK